MESSHQIILDLAAQRGLLRPRDLAALGLPNQTWYLSEPLRRQLSKIGRISPAEAPAGTYRERESLEALIVDELRRLHEGVLARYGLRPPQFIASKTKRRS